jgi:hypothetical protein
MHNIIPTLFVAATALVGCQSPSMVQNQTAAATVAAPAPFRPMLITTLGTNTTPDGTWRIGVSETSLDLSHSAATHGEGWTSAGWLTTGLDWWGCHAGWFVFTESESKVWAYDGDREVILLTYASIGKNSSSMIYDSHAGFHCTVPADVVSRLSEPAQRIIRSHN